MPACASSYWVHGSSAVLSEMDDCAEMLHFSLLPLFDEGYLED